MSDRPEVASRLAAQFGRSVGLDVAAAAVFRVRSSVLVELPRSRVIARVEPPTDEATAQRMVAAARFYEQRGAPTVRLAPVGKQPFVHSAGVVTLWQRLEHVDGDVSPHEIGRLVRRIHDASGPPFSPEIPPLDPLELVPVLLATPGPGFEPNRLGGLFDRLATLRARWDALGEEDPLGTVLAHGDVHRDNVVLTEDGPILLDLDLAGVGPASWDLAVPAVNSQRYGGSKSDIETCIEGYGADPRRWSGFDLLCRLYELYVVAWAVHCSRDTPAMAGEARLRVATLLDGATDPWSQH